MDWRKKIDQTNSENCFFSNIDRIQSLNSAITYIEGHLDSEVDYNEVARIACCSVHHFQRIFSYIAEIPLSEYIRRRRLTLAAFELQDSRVKVIDTAIKFGYESPEAFARAFKNMHGIAPSAVKESGFRLKAYPCVAFHISIKGETAMEYKIEKKAGFEIFGVATEISTVDNQNFTSVPKFWKLCRTDGTMTKIRRAAHLDDNTPLHAAMFNCTDTSYSYLIGYFISNIEVPKDFITLNVPASTWAIFRTEELSMIEAAQQAAAMWKRIFTEWFATSDYLLANAPELEVHYSKGNGKYITEIWIPVSKK